MVSFGPDKFGQHRAREAVLVLVSLKNFINRDIAGKAVTRGRFTWPNWDEKSSEFIPRCKIPQQLRHLGHFHERGFQVECCPAAALFASSKAQDYAMWSAQYWYKTPAHERKASSFTRKLTRPSSPPARLNRLSGIQFAFYCLFFLSARTFLVKRKAGKRWSRKTFLWSEMERGHNVICCNFPIQCEKGSEFVKDRGKCQVLQFSLCHSPACLGSKWMKWNPLPGTRHKQ